MLLNFSKGIRLDEWKALAQTDFEKSVMGFIFEWTNSDTFFNAQTSGSTGPPKRLKIEKQRARNSAQLTANYLGLQKGDSALLALPMTYIAGKMMLIRSMVIGLKLTLVEPTAQPLLGLKNTIDFCALTPFQVQNSSKELAFLDCLIIGGAALTPALVKKIKRYSKGRVYETYGMTETVSHIAMREIHPKESKLFSALSGVRLLTDERDCLEIFAPQLNSSKLQTNDRVLLSENKRKFSWLGRTDFVINSGGVKIQPEEVEQKLAEAISLPFFIAGIPDENLGEKVVLFIESENEFIIDLSRLNKFEKPKEVFFVNEFVRTVTGKVQRGETLSLFCKKD